jgi:hypothetical protein
MDPAETPRATVAIHAPARAFAPGTQTAMVRLGYRLVSAETAARHTEDGDPCRPAIRIVDDRQLESIPLESNGNGIPLILLTGHREPPARDPRAVGAVRRRARVNELFVLLQRALEPWPRTVPRVPAALPARCIRGNHGWAAAIGSISEKGCLLLSTERLEPEKRLDVCFALPREGLMQVPAQPSYVSGKRAGLVFRDTTEQSRSAIAHYVNTQLTAP